jgi:ELWxxDGT repeat protein
VFFVANDGVHGREIWVSDGTAAGTHIVKDMLAGAAGAWDNANPFLTAFGDRVYFSAFDEEHGRELWVTDGTDAGTKIFIDLKPGEETSEAIPVAAAGGKLFFNAAAAGLPAHFSRILWITDGTVSGTRAMKAADGLPVYYGSAARAAGGKL